VSRTTGVGRHPIIQVAIELCVALILIIFAPSNPEKARQSSVGKNRFGRTIPANVVRIPTRACLVQFLRCLSTAL
jgi:hypothetical protein